MASYRATRPGPDACQECGDPSISRSETGDVPTLCAQCYMDRHDQHRVFCAGCYACWEHWRAEGRQD